MPLSLSLILFMVWSRILFFHFKQKEGYTQQHQQQHDISCFLEVLLLLINFSILFFPLKRVTVLLDKFNVVGEFFSDCYLEACLEKVFHSGYVIKIVHRFSHISF